MNLKVNTKKFLEAIRGNHIGKVARYLDKGLDPNFHVSDDGKSNRESKIELNWFLFLFVLSETPLIIACLQIFEPRSMIMTLVNGGAHLDFRTRRGGLTPLHQCAIASRKEAIVVSLNTMNKLIDVNSF